MTYSNDFSNQKNSPEFIRYTGKRPLCTVQNLEALLKHIDFKIEYSEERSETNFFLADKNIGTFNGRPQYAARFLKHNLHLYSVCSQYRLSRGALGYFCIVLMTYPVSTIPAPKLQKTPPDVARKHLDNLKASLGEVQL
jgi:hypothetical protein